MNTPASSVPATGDADSSSKMNPSERHASLGLALIFALRMLGLFLVVPVFEIEASHYPGANPASIGLAMGVYGLTQAVLQLPFGMASDRFGRKRMITLGLVVFAIGSAVAALATSLDGLLWGRALQGAGAVSAAVTALLADLTRDAVRTKAMAIIGGSIGLVFSVALILSPLLDALMGLSGMFWLVAVLALLAIAGLYLIVPDEPPLHKGHAVGGSLAAVLRHPDMLRLNVSVFVLHAVQLAMWMVVPMLLVQAGLDKNHHWEVYLPAVIGSFVVMGGVLFRMERQGRLREVFLTSIVLVGWCSSRCGGSPAARPAASHPRCGASRWRCWCSSAASTCSKPPSPASCRAWPRRRPVAWLWASTTPCSRSACSRVVRSAACCSRWPGPRPCSWAARP